MKRFRVAPAARDDLKRISHYVAVEKQSPQGAERLRGLFLECFRQLADNPFLGQACPEFGENIRISLVGNYVVLYLPRNGGIDIVQVTHGAETFRRSCERRQSIRDSRRTFLVPYQSNLTGTY